TGLQIEGGYRLVLRKKKKNANAALAGLGKSRRVLLGDTLLEKFTPEEIAVVFAHEIGHHVHKHIPKMILFGIFTTMLGFWLVDLLLRQGTGTLTSLSNVAFSFKHPAALPLVLFVLSVFGLILSPLENALSRFHERQCDRYALERTGLHDGYRSAFVKLATMNKSDPDPHPLVVWLLHDHPPIRERISMAG
ncbi:MAG: M48 family metalloprotease, partial [Gemmataceae bacterium]